MFPIVFNVLLGFFLVPALLFIVAIGLARVRSRPGMPLIMPEKIALLIILGTLASWIVTGINILILVLRR